MKNTKEIGNIKTIEKQETMPVGTSSARPCFKGHAITGVGAISNRPLAPENCLKEKYNQAGITLIALVITIIILLILSAVTINLTLGEHGIFNTAKRAGEKYKISEYLEKIELARISAVKERMGEITLEDIVEQIYKDKVVPEGSITIGDDYAVMTTPEGDNFIITKEDAEYIEENKEDLLQPVTSIEIEPENIELKIGEKKTITAKVSPEKAYSKKISWINGNEDIIKIGEQKINADKTVSIEITAISGGTTNVTAKSVHGENGKEITGECTVKVKKPANYGTSIQSNYTNLYTTDYPNGFNGQIQDTSNVCAYGNGNYKEARLLSTSDTKMINVAPYASIHKNLSCVYSGTNTMNFSETVSSGWITIYFYANGNTEGVNISNLKLCFVDDVLCTINDAITNAYIEPLVICHSSNNNSSWVWGNIMNILSGGSTSTSDHSVASIILKVKDKSKLKGIIFYTNKDWVTRYDGVGIYKWPEGYEISTTPLD